MSHVSIKRTVSINPVGKIVSTLPNTSLWVCVQEATVAFHKLSPAQFNTGWVLCQLGRAYYEMVDYPAAANVFEFARQADRHRLEVCGYPV